MKIGIAGPFFLSELIEFLYERYRSVPNLPKGMGGTGVNLLVRGLVERGYHMVLFTLDSDTTEEVILDGPHLRICVGHYRGRIQARYRALDLFRKERAYICQAIEREQPDIVHAHWTYEYALGALSSSAPTLITVRDWAPIILWYSRWNYRNMAYRTVRLIMDLMTFKKARHLSANSEYTRQRILKRWRRDVPILPNPIPDKQILEGEKSFAAHKPVILAVTNGLGRLKNMKPLLRAFPRIRKKIPGCHLMLVGIDFQPNGPAEKWMRAKGLEEGVVFAGPHKHQDAMRLMDQAALVIHPALEESFGNVLIEAMARQTPVLGGKDAGAVPWILDYGRAGALCDVRSAEDIAEKAIEILVSPARWQQLSQAGYEQVLEKFSLSNVVDLCLTQYQRVLDMEKGANIQSKH